MPAKTALFNHLLIVQKYLALIMQRLIKKSGGSSKRLTTPRTTLSK